MIKLFDSSYHFHWTYAARRLKMLKFVNSTTRLLGDKKKNLQAFWLAFVLWEQRKNYLQVSLSLKCT